DVSARWEGLASEGLRANAPARADLPLLRFAALRVELAIEGQGALLLRPASADAVAITLDDRQIALGECSLPRDTDAPCKIERDAERLTLACGERSTRCKSAALVGHVAIALTLERDATLRAFSVTRL